MNDALQPLIKSQLRYDRRLLAGALIVSTLLHLLFYFRVSIGSPGEDQNGFESTVVELVELPQPKSQKQIVRPADRSDEIATTDAALLSDIDSQAKVETIRRGEEGGQKGKQTPPSESTVPSPDEKARTDAKAIQLPPVNNNQNEKVEPKPENKTSDKSQPKLKQVPKSEIKPEAKASPSEVDERQTVAKKISPNSLFLGDKFKSSPPDQTSPSTQKEPPTRLKPAAPTYENKIRNDYKPFTSVPFIPGTSGRDGSADLLPQIPDGEMTMLNAKAERFAVFVRRVAQQVFGLLRVSNWSQLSSSEIRQIGEYTKIHAVMSPEGKFIKLWLENSSGSVRFDKVVTGSIERGLDDQNPPPSARSEDGNYHFVFISKTWTRPAMTERAGEQRWILLGTGLL